MHKTWMILPWLCLLGIPACGGGDTAETTTGSGTAASTGSGSTTGTGGAGGHSSSDTTTSSTGGNQPGADAACASLAEAKCLKLDDCTNDTGVLEKYGDKPTCVARLKLGCLLSLAAAGTSSTPEASEACAAGMAAESCDTYFDGPPPAECAVLPGDLPNGTSCAFNAQCAGMYCNQPKDLACGACSTVPQIGDSCVTKGCGALACGNSSNVCVALGTAGSACDKDNPCHSTLSCVGSGAGVMGECMLAGAAVGAACDSKADVAPECNHDLGLRCDGATNQCVVYEYATGGQPCGKVGTGKTVCTGGAECVIPMNLTVGTCVAPVSDGAACDTDVGPPCLRPAKCITNGSGTAGVCQLPDASVCL